MGPESDNTSGYQALMPYRVRDILLVASSYDSFILEQDGSFGDQLLAQYLELSLEMAPRFHWVSSDRAAVKQLEARSCDMVLTTPQFAGGSSGALAEQLKARKPDVPVVMLTYDRPAAQRYAAMAREAGFDHVFLWGGDPRLLLAIVKTVEDEQNAAHDTRLGLVRVVLVIEDSPSFYSAYLPIIYTEIVRQTRILVAAGLNAADRLYRMRARPKILLARSFEEAEMLLGYHRPYLMGVIADMRFPRGGTADPRAGRDFITLLKRVAPAVPVLLQSAEPDHEEVARELDVSFADKRSPDLLDRLRDFMSVGLGFGPFVFRGDDGEEFGRAQTIPDLVPALDRVPDEALMSHATRNDFSNWLYARAEFRLANELRRQDASRFKGAAEMRRFLVSTVRSFLDRRQRGRVVEFARSGDLLKPDFSRLGTGSMGGKARGLAYMAKLLADHEIHERYPEVKIRVPQALVLCTEVFERFCAQDDLRARAVEAESDAEVVKLFLEHSLDDELREDLRAWLGAIDYPLAVRSSNLLEDSGANPLAGLYRTYLVPNSGELAVRVAELGRAIRLVLASTFFKGPMRFLEQASRSYEEADMAVLLQQLVGRRFGDRFYPHVAGVAQSYNFYPLEPMQPADGLVTAALGLGRTVVQDGVGLRFCPKYPQVLPQMSSPAEALRYSQRRFYALDLTRSSGALGEDDAANLLHLELDDAEQDGALAAAASTYVEESDRIYDTIHKPGARLVTFAPMLRQGRFPLAEIVGELLSVAGEGLATPVEMEFAVTLNEGDEPDEFSVLQLRPMVSPSGPGACCDVRSLAPGERSVVAGPALGNGLIPDIRDVVYVHPDRFDSGRTERIAAHVGRINDVLVRQRRPYMILAPGRWGTSDRFLGIPVSWAQVAGARVMVELAHEGFRPDPSQGTHFFHNITALQIGYFSVDLTDPGHTADLDWLESLPAVQELGRVRHVEVPDGLDVRIDGTERRGIAVARAGSG